MRRPVVAALSVTLALGGYATLDVYDRVPGILTLAPEPDPVPPSPAPGAPVAVPLPRPEPPGMPLAASGAQGTVPSPAGLQAALAPVLAEPALGRSVSVAVRDAATGSHLLDLDPDRPRTPASAVKLLSAVGVNSAFPRGAALTTKVVQGREPGQVVLVAGGDTLLSPGAGDPNAVAGRAGLGDLAALTAKALQDKGVRAVTLAVDLGYAPGPLSAPSWSPSFVANGITGAVAMLGLSTQRATPGHPGPANPPPAVAAALAAALRQRGVATTVQQPPVTADQDAPVLGSVVSAPVADQLALALDESDNALTESLTRQAAFLRGAGTTFAQTADFVRTTIAGLGVDVTGATAVDACGLSREDAVPARLLADVIGLGLADKVPGMRDTLSRLPVAGLTGTLSDRFTAPGTHPAAGVARAKTGTLTGVNAIAGTLVTVDGRLLTFAVLAEGSPPGAGTLLARGSLDRFVAVLASCGCR